MILLALVLLFVVLAPLVVSSVSHELRLRRRLRHKRTLTAIEVLERELFPPPRVFGRRRIPGTLPLVSTVCASAYSPPRGPLYASPGTGPRLLVQWVDDVRLVPATNYSQIMGAPRRRTRAELLRGGPPLGG